MNIFLANIGAELRRVRIARGMTLQQVADSIGVDVATACRREGGSTFPVEDLEKYGRCFGVPASTLIGGAE